jgi:hypothetical protein
MASKTTKAFALTLQTIKTFEKCSFWRNVTIIPLPRVIFQLKKIKNKKIKNFKK